MICYLQDPSVVFWTPSYCFGFLAKAITRLLLRLTPEMGRLKAGMLWKAGQGISCIVYRRFPANTARRGCPTPAPAPPNICCRGPCARKSPGFLCGFRCCIPASDLVRKSITDGRIGKEPEISRRTTVQECDVSLGTELLRRAVRRH